MSFLFMSFRRAARIDVNQTEIVDEFRRLGASVKIVSQLKDFVDVVVGYKGFNYLVEIKDGEKPKSAQRLTPGEEKFHAEWKGSTAIIYHKSEVKEFLRGK